jgi:hypothetical protein
MHLPGPSDGKPIHHSLSQPALPERGEACPEACPAPLIFIDITSPLPLELALQVFHVSVLFPGCYISFYGRERATRRVHSWSTECDLFRGVLSLLNRACRDRRATCSRDHRRLATAPVICRS